jgi:hypothetical protein
MASADPPSEIAVLCYQGAQMSAVHGLTDIFGVANDNSARIHGDAGPILRVSHWWPASAAGPVERTFDTHPGLPGRRAQTETSQAAAQGG